MNAMLNGELVWYRRAGVVTMGIVVKSGTSASGKTVPSYIQVSNVPVQAVRMRAIGPCLYRCPITITVRNGVWYADSVYAILAGSDSTTFQGSQLNFRDIMQAGKRENLFIYVLPVANVTSNDVWQGYVRLGYRNWIVIPCPRPQSVYNRIPTRYLERRPVALEARKRLKTLGIPIFNPEYFNKAQIYSALRNAELEHFLPNTQAILNEHALRNMLEYHSGVYLKPAGGSVGHGVIRITKEEHRKWNISVLKNGFCDTQIANTLDSVWRIVCDKRVPGNYVIQEAIRLVEWNGRPCDFRVLVQKSKDKWILVGKGVRVSGPNTITTHVPNGGSIANAEEVLSLLFDSRREEVEQALDDMVIQCAQAIDEFYGGLLGEMSMDIGVDEDGNPWFFEANSKPMKFDEPDIREKSLQGVLNYLQELHLSRPKDIIE